MTDRRAAVRVATLLVVAVATGCGCGGRAEDREPRPNVILLSLDSCRPDHLSCYGYHRRTSPAIDAIAARGVLFENAFSSTSWTLPAHMAMLTSLPDSVHGVDDNNRPPLDPARTTLAQQFHAAGYNTAAFVSGPYLHRAFGFDRGFDEYVDCSRALDLTPAPDGRSEVPFQPAPHEASHGDITNPRLFGAVQEWLDRPRDAPFFLFVHVWDIHYDFIPPAPYDRMFDPDYTGSVDGVDFAHSEAIHPGMAARDLEHVIALYDGEIAYTDEYIGKLMGRLGELGLRDDTVIAITADHGEEFFEHGRKGHQKTLYDEVLRIPLIVSWPGHLPEGARVGRQARIIDIAPTLAELARLPANPEAAGRSLLPAIAGQGDELPVYAELRLRAAGVEQRALRLPEAKVVWSDTHGRGYAFAIDEDPSESRPLGADDERTRRARALLDETTRGYQALAAALPKGEKLDAVELDEESLERLRSLGYLDGQ